MNVDLEERDNLVFRTARTTLRQESGTRIVLAKPFEDGKPWPLQEGEFLQGIFYRDTFPVSCSLKVDEIIDNWVIFERQSDYARVQRRRAVRIICNIPCSFLPADIWNVSKAYDPESMKWHRGRILDLSTGGLRLLTAATKFIKNVPSLLVDTSLLLRFTCDSDQMLLVKGLIVRCTEEKITVPRSPAQGLSLGISEEIIGTVRTVPAFEIGLCFTRIEMCQNDILCSYLSVLERKQAKELARKK